SITSSRPLSRCRAERPTSSSFFFQAEDGIRDFHVTGVQTWLFRSRADSPVRELADLRGRSIAFQNPLSTSSYYVPATELLDAGLRLEVLLSPMDRPAPESVGYVFGRSELNVSAWVHKGLVDAGAMSNLDWVNPQRVPPSYRRDFRIVRETPSFPRAVEMVRGDLDPRVRERLREVLLGAADDPDAREALLRFFMTTRFVPVADATARALAPLRRGVARVSREVE